MKVSLRKPLCGCTTPISARLIPIVIGIAVYGLTQPTMAAGQAAGQGGRTISLAVGTAQLVSHPSPMRRVSVSNADIAEAVVVSPTELLVNGKSIGTTSLVIWDSEGRRTLYPVEVTLDAAALENQFRALFPGEPIEVTSSGNIYILSGSVTNSTTAARAVEIARATQAMVVNNIAVPSPHQILLQVRFAEVSRTALQELGSQFLDFGNKQGGFVGTGRFITPPDFAVGDNSSSVDVIADLATLFLFDTESNVAAVIRALQSKGLFRSLAEPNLLALDGQKASFLAGGEFPYPVLQGGQSDAITVVFKEFGIRLNFTPVVQTSGNIQLEVEPEVSTLDFASGLQLGGFQIPALLTRRAKTRIELRDGQTFAIAGLIDNAISENIDRIPILGHIPILGALFRSQDLAQRRSELLVLVTPHLVQPSDVSPPLPSGDPADWDWKEDLDEPVGQIEQGGDSR